MKKELISRDFLYGLLAFCATFRILQFFVN